MNQTTELNVSFSNKTARSEEIIRKMIEEYMIRSQCPPERLKDIQIAGWILLAEGIGTVLLNIVVICLISKQKKKSIMAFLILNLAISDLTVALFNDFPKMAQHFYPWNAGDELCVCFQISKEIALFASTYLLLSLSIDRLIAIKTPLSTTRRNKKYKVCMVALPWILGFIFSLSHLKSSVVIRCGDLENIQKSWCTVDMGGTYGQVMIYLTTIVQVVIPAVLLISIYGYIFYLIRHRSSNDSNPGSNHTDALRSNQSTALQRAKKRSLIITLAVGLVFIICWMPSSLGTYIAAHSYELELKSSFYTLESLAALNSFANPIIVLIFNYKMFREKSATQSASTKLTLTTSLRSSRNKDGCENNIKTELVKDRDGED